MPDALILSTSDSLSGSRQWSNLDPGERKRKAAEACAARDIPALWHLSQSYWTLFGASGAHVSPNSIAAYKRGVTVFIEDTAHSGHSIMRFPRDAAAVWVRTQEQAGLSTSTIQVRLAAARMLYKALRWAGVVETDPLADIKPARDPTPRWEKRHPYSDADIERLLSVCTNARDRVLLLLGSRAGLRISEALALRFEDIDLAADVLVVRKGKGEKARSVPVAGTLGLALSALPNRTGMVLPYRTRQTAAQHIRRLCQRAGVRWRGLHAMRHTAGTRVVSSGGTLQDAARLLGHSGLGTVEVYAKWSDRGLKDMLRDW